MSKIKERLIGAGVTVAVAGGAFWAIAVANAGEAPVSVPKPVETVTGEHTARPTITPMPEPTPAPAAEPEEEPVAPEPQPQPEVEQPEPQAVPEEGEIPVDEIRDGPGAPASPIEPEPVPTIDPHDR